MTGRQADTNERNIAMSDTPNAATLADMIAAAELGALDPTAVQVIRADEIGDAIARAERDAYARGAQDAVPVHVDGLPTDHHECGIEGCRHGASHDGPSQPDRQVKLACPNCGAIARMTRRAILRAAAQVGALDETGGYPRCVDGGTYLPAATRAYRKAGTAE